MQTLLVCLITAAFEAEVFGRFKEIELTAHMCRQFLLSPVVELNISSLYLDPLFEEDLLAD